MALLTRSVLFAIPYFSARTRQRGTIWAPRTIDPVRRTVTSVPSIWPVSTLHCSSDPFDEALHQSDWIPEQKQKITATLESLGLYSSSASQDARRSSTLLALCQGLTASDISQMLIRDFSVEPLLANQIRTIVMQAREQQQSQPDAQPAPAASSTIHKTRTKLVMTDSSEQISTDTTQKVPAKTSKARQQLRYKEAVVNQAAVRRKQQQQTYQLDVTQFPNLQQELDRFFRFMTEPSTLSQEDPIRPATANIYLLHAKLFLGWYVSEYKDYTRVDPQLALNEILSSKDKETASIMIQFIMWLRKVRQISVNYEANLLRGLIKLLKYCFASESIGGDNRKTYEDIPVIQELRRLHRNAYKQAKLAPKSSNEGQKWMSWPEYLKVVQATKADFERLAAQEAVAARKPNQDDPTPLQRKVAVAFQKYLVLAVFTNVPDRQRTVRELCIGRTLIKDNAVEGRWYIKHNPGDYKPEQPMENDRPCCSRRRFPPTLTSLSTCGG